jgi:hypothetical protein
LESNSNFTKYAADPKFSAFMRTIQDNDVDEMQDIEYTPDLSGAYYEDFIPDSQADNLGKHSSDEEEDEYPAKRKRLASDRSSDIKAKKVPKLGEGLEWMGNIRRKNFGHKSPDRVFKVPSLNRKPSSAKEVTEAVNALLEPPGDGFTPIAEIEGDKFNEQNLATSRASHVSTEKYVDRYDQRCIESSSVQHGGRLAFAEPELKEYTPRVPSLVNSAMRSNSSFNGQDENGISTNNNAKQPMTEVHGKGVSTAGSAKSSVNWYAREAERKAALEKKAAKSDGSKVSNRRAAQLEASGLTAILSKQDSWKEKENENEDEHPYMGIT